MTIRERQHALPFVLIGTDEHRPLTALILELFPLFDEATACLDDGLEGLKAMAIKRVWIEEGCISCGVGEEVCPEVFKLVDTNTVIEGVDLSRFEDKIKEAAESCPVDVIKYE